MDNFLAQGAKQLNEDAGNTFAHTNIHTYELAYRRKVKSREMEISALFKVAI